MKKTCKILICIGVIAVIANLFVFVGEIITILRNNQEIRAEIINRKDTIKAPYIRISQHNESNVTTPLKKKVKLELTATMEEFKHYLMTNKFTNETTNHIVIIGDKIGDDTKDIKWTIYY